MTTVTVTSKEANNILRKLYEEKSNFRNKEIDGMEFHAAVGEKLDDVRPDYNFEETKECIEIIDNQILAIKHAINLFNSSTIVGDTGLTIDQVLIKLGMLTERKQKFARMRSTQEKRRSQITGNVIDYIYANFDIEAADMAYEEADAELKHLQTALDLVNNTVTFEISY